MFKIFVEFMDQWWIFSISFRGDIMCWCIQSSLICKNKICENVNLFTIWFHMNIFILKNMLDFQIPDLDK